MVFHLPDFYYPEQSNQMLGDTDDEDEPNLTKIHLSDEIGQRYEKWTKQNESNQIKNAYKEFIKETLNSWECHLNQQEGTILKIAQDFNKPEAHTASNLELVLCTQVINLNTQAQRMMINTKYLVELSETDWQEQVIVLPDICVTGYASEFQFNNANSIRMVNWHKHVDRYFNEFTKNRYIAGYHMYFTGCYGCGKSFLVYQLACRLMAQPDNVVVYVQQCNSKIVYSILRTLYVVCKSLDLPKINKLLEGYKLTLKGEDNDVGLETVIESFKAHKYDPEIVNNVITYFRKELLRENKYLIIIIDQANIIMENREMYKNQIEFVNMLLRNQNVILSASPNNEVSHMKVEFNFTHNVHLLFDQTDFLAFLAVKHLVDKSLSGKKTDVLRQETIESILDLTGANPYEVNRFISLHSQAFADYFPPLDKWSSHYRDDFESEYRENKILEWYQEKDSAQKEKALQLIIDCFVRRPVRAGVDCYDKRLIVLRLNQPLYRSKTAAEIDKTALETEKTAHFLECISPCAYEVLYRSYDVYLTESLIKDFNGVINSRLIDQHPSVSGICVEKYLIILIRLKKLDQMSVVSIDKNLEESRYELVITNFDEVFLNGCRAPESTLDKGKNCLFIPLSNQYPGYDFVYYHNDGKTPKALFINVTVQDNPFAHVKKNDNNAKQEKWVKRVIGQWKKVLPETNFIDAYVVLRSKIKREKPDWRECNMVFIEDLLSTNQELHKLTEK